MYNVVPSISAVTGISPGRYLWRIVVALHLGPRALVVATFYNFLLSFVPRALAYDEEQRKRRREKQTDEDR